MKRCCWMSLTCLFVAFLAGCGESPPGRQVKDDSAIQLVANVVFQEDASEPRLAGLIPAADLFEPSEVDQMPTSDRSISEQSTEPQAAPGKNQTWSFPPDNTSEVLLKLPAVEVLPTFDARLGNPATTKVEPEPWQPIASLLPPQSLDAAPELMTQYDKANDVAVVEGVAEPVTPQEIDSASAEKKLVAAVIRDCTAATTGVLTDQRVNELAKAKIRGAYAMANRGGYYAARQALVEVLRMISHARDAQQGTLERSEALAQGLRALEEAEDFAPRGIQLEADLAIEVLCASHRTPIAKQIGSQDVLPYQMMNGYFRYAQLKLAAAVAGEPAGSMALHALGKLATHLGQVEPEKHRLSQRQAIAFQRAALLAHSENYLAAHELATLLADAGHFAEAEKLLQRVASRDPNAVVLRNLSLMQEKLGLSQQAIASRASANQLAQQGVSGTNNVQWVSPQDFSRTGIAGPAPVAAAAVATTVAQPPIRIPGSPPQRGPIASPGWR